MQSFNKFALFILLFAVAFQSCDNDDDVQSGELSLNVQYLVNDAAFNYGETYVVGGTAIQFDFVQFYLSGASLQDANGVNAGDFSDTYLLVKPEQQSYDLGERTADVDAQRLTFNVGIDAATNSQTETDFTEREESDPLSFQTPEKMHWSWTTGYIFLKINAQVDTDADGIVDTATEYHIGTDNYLTELELSGDDLVANNQIALDFDVANLFTSIDLASDGNTHTFDNQEMAQQITSNYAAAFTLR